MEVSQLESVHKELWRIIKQTKEISNEKFVEDEYNRTDFVKYKRYIEWSIGILRGRIWGHSNQKTVEVIELKSELKKMEFVMETINKFIEWELQDLKDKIF